MWCFKAVKPEFSGLPDSGIRPVVSESRPLVPACLAALNEAEDLEDRLQLPGPGQQGLEGIGVLRIHRG